MSPIEKARAAKASQRSARRTVACPKCGVTATLVLPSAVISHRCPAAGHRLTTFKEVAA